MISEETAVDIAFAYREIEVAKELLAKIEEETSKHREPDIRDAFGRPVGGLQLGVPSGPGSHRIFNLPWHLARPIIQAHIASKEALIMALNEKVRAELAPDPRIGTGFIRKQQDDEE